ncbi:hypothetical protein FQZ97_731860 [compost metagenome]
MHPPRSNGWLSTPPRAMSPRNSKPMCAPATTASTCAARPCCAPSPRTTRRAAAGCCSCQATTWRSTMSRATCWSRRSRCCCRAAPTRCPHPYRSAASSRRRGSAPTWPSRRLSFAACSATCANRPRPSTCSMRAATARPWKKRTSNSMRRWRRPCARRRSAAASARPRCSTWRGHWCWPRPRARTTWCSAPCCSAGSRAARARGARSA